ncbi:MAG TPA: YxlC family protein [Bacillales bacterium]|nr:YxlC family protein [Bacillales bacterium]
MKKQKVNMQTEQQNDEDFLVIHELQRGLDQIETFQIQTPDLQWFEQIILTEQHRIKKKLMKEVFLFSVIALLILGGIMMSLYQMPIVFIILQISTTIFIALYIGVKHSKKVIEHER